MTKSLTDKEIEIAHGLAESILHYEELLTTASDICGELDRSALRCLH